MARHDTSVPAYGLATTSFVPPVARVTHEQRYVDGEPEPFSPEEAAVVIPDRAPLADIVEEEVGGEGLTPETLHILDMRARVLAGEPTPTRTRTPVPTPTPTRTPVPTPTPTRTPVPTPTPTPVPTPTGGGELDAAGTLGAEGPEEAEPLDRLVARWAASEPGQDEVAGADGLRPLHGVDTEANVIMTRRADEFACAGCFLLRRVDLLADPVHRLCRECVA